MNENGVRPGNVVQSTGVSWLDIAVTCFVLACSVALLQYHSIEFWRANVDQSVGAVWSLLLEVIALWLWFQRGFVLRMVGLVASVLLLAGPMYSVGTPLVKEMFNTNHGDSARVLQIQQMEQGLVEAQKGLNVYLTNSEKRPGWAPLIEKAQDSIAQSELELARLRAEPPKSPLDWMGQFVIGMQMIGLVLFQLNSVFAITRLSKMRREWIDADRVNTRSIHSGRESGIEPESNTWASEKAGRSGGRLDDEALPARYQELDEEAGMIPPETERVLSGYDGADMDSEERIECAGESKEWIDDVLAGDDGNDVDASDVVTVLARDVHVMKRLKELIERMIDERKISQREFAATFNIHPIDVSRLLRQDVKEGRRRASERSVKKLVELFIMPDYREWKKGKTQ